jgi:hypothetical protein
MKARANNVEDRILGHTGTVGIIGSFPLTSGSHFKVLDGITRDINP